jgi:CheY-like chemotaxis protein
MESTSWMRERSHPIDGPDALDLDDRARLATPTRCTAPPPDRGDEPEAEDPTVPVRRTPSGVVRKVRVLLVDDDPAVLRVLELMLTRGYSGYQVTTAREVAAAIEVLNEWPVDVIVSDVQMSGGSGCDLHREVAARWPGLEASIVFLSGGYGDQEARQLRATGCLVLHKPTPRAELLDAIARVGERRGGFFVSGA